MKRRQFLGVSTGVMGVLLGGGPAGVVRRNLGVGSVAAERVESFPPRAREIDGRVDAVEGTTASVAVTPRESDVSGRLLVVRRQYPGGAVLNAGQTDPLSIEGPTTVELDLPREGIESGPWFYECSLQPGDDAEPAFVCESDPYRWRDGGGRSGRSGRNDGGGWSGRSGRSGGRAVPADRVTETPAPTDGDQFSREREDNDYVLNYGWWDSGPERWTLDYRLRRSVHEAAVDRERGYVKTFEESVASPVARDLADAIGRDATRAADGNGDGVGAGGSAADRFDLLVRFVQDIQYRRDAESMGVYDYPRTVEETLLEGVGDCKDKSFLLAGLLSAQPLSCDVALLFQPAHVLLGVAAADVPGGIDARETVELGGREYVPVDPSFRFPIGDYPDADITAAYGDGEWLHYDFGAIGRGMERNVRDFLENGTRK